MCIRLDNMLYTKAIVHHLNEPHFRVCFLLMKFFWWQNWMLCWICIRQCWNKKRYTLNQNKYIQCNFSEECNDKGVEVCIGEQVLLLNPKESYNLGSMIHNKRMQRTTYLSHITYVRGKVNMLIRCMQLKWNSKKDKPLVKKQ